MTDDLIELHLPPKAEYVPIVRALAGVIAGEMSFTYDEIVQIRVAVSELFEIGVRNSKVDPIIKTARGLN